MDPLDHKNLTDDLVEIAREQGLYKPDLLAAAAKKRAEELRKEKEKEEAEKRRLKGDHDEIKEEGIKANETIEEPGEEETQEEPKEETAKPMA